MNRHTWTTPNRNQPKKHAQAVRQDDRRAPASGARALWAACVLRRAGWF